MTQTAKNGTDVLDRIGEVVDHVGAGRVFGTPISEDGLTVVPVAKVSGGGGGGIGMRPAETGSRSSETGSGGGLGLSAKPLGVFVIKHGTVRWRPAVDVNRVIMGGQIVAIAALLVLRGLVKAYRHNNRRGNRHSNRKR